MRNRAAAGPFVRSPVRPLQIKKHECFIVLMRNQKPGETQGRWQPISTSGFTVVCPSKLEACECVWLVGGRYFPRPPSLMAETKDADFVYLRWLLDEHFRITPHTAGEFPMEVWFSDFIRGWYPACEDIPGRRASADVVASIEQALRFRWEGR